MKKRQPNEQEFITAIILCIIIGIIGLYIFGKSAVWFFVLLIIYELFHFRIEFKSILIKCIFKIKNRSTHNKENNEAQFLSQEIEKVKQETEQTVKAYYEKTLELEVNKAKEETKQALEAEYKEKLKKISLSSTDETNNIENMKDEEEQIKDTDKTETFNLDFTFANNGKPYHFGNQSCGDGGQFIPIDYSWPGGCLFDLRSVELITKDKKIILKLGYESFSSISYKEIPVLPEELDAAQQIVAYLSKLIIKNEEIHKKYTAEIDGAEEVRLIDVDGSVKKVSVYTLIDDDDYCVIGDGNNDYHKHLDCFSNWRLAERKQFKEWKGISTEEAKKQGRKYCKFCSRDDKINKKILEDWKSGKDYDYEHYLNLFKL